MVATKVKLKEVLSLVLHLTSSDQSKTRGVFCYSCVLCFILLCGYVCWVSCVDAGVMTVSIVLGVLGVSFGVVALRVWYESRRVREIREIVNTLVSDPRFRKELVRALRRELIRESKMSKRKGSERENRSKQDRKSRK